MNLSKVDIERAYTYVSSKEEHEWTHIQLTDLTREYSGIVFKYGEVSLGEETESGEMPLTFHYDVILSKDKTNEELQEDSDFKNLLGDILVDILEKQFKDNSLQYVNND